MLGFWTFPPHIKKNLQTILNGNFVFDLHNVFREGIPGRKKDLPVLITAECTTVFSQLKVT